ncbi:MAG: ATP-binding protein, partial [Spirochaetota bacterium]
QGEVVEVNRAMLELLGLQSRDELESALSLAAIIDAGDEVTAVATPPARRRTELAIRCSDDRELLLQVTAAQIPKAPASPPYTALFVEDVTELRRFERDLQDRQRALRALFFNEETIREKERTSLSRDIHDVLGQMLTAHKMDLHWLKSQGADGTENFAEMIEHIDQMIGFVKRVCSELRDSVLDDFGFETALDEHLKQFRERSGMRVEFENEFGEIELPHDLAVSLLRIIQEALTNVARHASASQVVITASGAPDRIVWTVEDNGRGFDMADVDMTSSLGLVGMTERAASWGGTVDLSSSPGQGTTVVVGLPLVGGAAEGSPSMAHEEGVE